TESGQLTAVPPAEGGPGSGRLISARIAARAGSGVVAGTKAAPSAMTTSRSLEPPGIAAGDWADSEFSLPGSSRLRLLDAPGNGPLALTSLAAVSTSTILRSSAADGRRESRGGLAGAGLPGLARVRGRSPAADSASTWCGFASADSAETFSGFAGPSFD